MLANKVRRRLKIRHKIRKKIKGTATCPRLCVFRSNKEIYAQLIDDVTGTTFAAASSRDAGVASAEGGNIAKAKLVGQAIGEKAKSAGIDKVVFDRSGYLYHGRVKALAEGARESGLSF